MVSFTCHLCQDVVKKPKVVGHAALCGRNEATFSCVDCMQVFDLQTIKSHTSCVTETQKYQGQWLEKKKNGAQKASLPPLERQPRPAMNDLSDSDDDDWVTSSKASSSKMNVSCTGKRARSEEDVTVNKSSRVETSGNNNNKKRVSSTLTSVVDEASSSSCELERFALGPASEISSIIANILQTEGIPSGNACVSMQKKQLAKALVSRYRGRIAKYLMATIDDVVQKYGYLSEGKTGITLNEKQFDLQKQS